MNEFKTTTFGFGFLLLSRTRGMLPFRWGGGGGGNSRDLILYLLSLNLLIRYLVYHFTIIFFTEHFTQYLTGFFFFQNFKNLNFQTAKTVIRVTAASMLMVRDSGKN